jgi:hypothetical protein
MRSGRVREAAAANRSYFSQKQTAHTMIVIALLHCVGYLQCFNCVGQARISALMMTFSALERAQRRTSFARVSGTDFAGSRLRTMLIPAGTYAMTTPTGRN